MGKLIFLIIEEIRIFFKSKSGVFWVIVFPTLSLLILGLVFGNFESSKTRIGIFDFDSSTTSNFYIENLKIFKNLTIHILNNKNYTKELKNNNLDIILIINSTLRNRKSPITLIYDSNKTQNIFYALTSIKSYTQAFKEAILSKDSRTLITPIETEEINIRSQEMSYIEFLIPGIISMAILSITLFSVGIKFSYMKGSGFLKRLSIVPFSPLYYIIANIVSYLIIILCVSFLLLTEAHYLFHVTLPFLFIRWIGFLVLGSSCYLAMAFLFPAFTHNGDQADIAGQMLFFAMMFLSNSYFPIDNMPKVLRYMAYIFPNTYFNDGLRRLYFSNMYQPYRILTDSAILFLLLLLFTGIATFKFKWVDEK